MTDTMIKTRKIYCKRLGRKPQQIGTEVTKEEFYALSAEQLRSTLTRGEEGRIFANSQDELTLQILENHDFFKVGTGFSYKLDKHDICALSANQLRAAILNSLRYDIFRGTDGEFHVIPLDYLNYGIESDLGKDGIYWGLERAFDR